MAEFSFPISPSNKELILSLGAEGEGIEIYRTRSKNGEWRFFSSYSNVFDQDEYEIPLAPGTKESFRSLSELLDSLSIRQSFLALIVDDLHEEYREELLKWAQDAYRYLPNDLFSRSPAFDVVTPEIWVDNYTRSAKFSRRNAEVSAKLYQQLRNSRR